MKFLHHHSRRYVSALCAIALMATSLAQAFAQQPATSKRVLFRSDYDAWHSIQSPQISRDGKFVAYAYMAQDEDSEIVARNLATGQEWRAPRGYRPPAPPPDDSLPNSGELIAAQARLTRPAITADTRFVVFSIEPTKADLNKAKRGSSPAPGSPTGQPGWSGAVREGAPGNASGARDANMPKNALGIMDLSSGQVAKIDRVKNFQVPEDGGGFIAYLMEAKPVTERGSSPTVKEGVSDPNQTGKDAGDLQAGMPAVQRGSK